MAELIEYPAKRKEMKTLMRSLITFLPDLVKLLYRLMRDIRVSKADKVVLAGTIIYVISPLDFIPDLIPFIGQVDDMYLVALALLRLINHTSADVIESHWHNAINIKSLITTISNVAHFFLPARLRNILVGKLEHQAEITDMRTYVEKRNHEQ